MLLRIVVYVSSVFVFIRFVGHIGACSTKCNWDVLPDALCLAYCDCPLCVCAVSVNYLVYFL